MLSAERGPSSNDVPVTQIDYEGSGWPGFGGGVIGRFMAIDAVSGVPGVGRSLKSARTATSQARISTQMTTHAGSGCVNTSFPVLEISARKSAMTWYRRRWTNSRLPPSTNLANTRWMISSASTNSTPPTRNGAPGNSMGALWIDHASRRSRWTTRSHEANLLSRVGEHTSASSAFGCTLPKNRV